MNEVNVTQQPELYTLIQFLNEVNERTEKNVAGINDCLNKLMPSPQTVDEIKVDKSNLSGALGELHDLITRANVNCMRLDQLNAHFRKII